MVAPIERIPVSHQPEITTLFGPPKWAGKAGQPSVGTSLRNFGRFVGRALMFFSMIIFLLSGYLAFNHHWFKTHWIKSDATVLTGELRQLSSGSSMGTGTTGHSSPSYFFHCTVSYSVAGKTRQSQLDSPFSPHLLDAQVWASTWSPGQHIDIRYQDSNPSRIFLDDDPSAITAIGSLRFAFYFLIPGILLMRISRPERSGAHESDILR